MEFEHKGAGRRGEEPTPSQAGRPEHTQTPQQRGEGVSSVPLPQGEQSQPQQERGEGNKAEQPIFTFDGHEPKAWKLDPLIFGKRVLTGLDALHERSRAGVRDRKRIFEKVKAEGSWPVTKDGKPDLDALLSSPQGQGFGGLLLRAGSNGSIQPHARLPLWKPARGSASRWIEPRQGPLSGQTADFSILSVAKGVPTRPCPRCSPFRWKVKPNEEMEFYALVL